VEVIDAFDGLLRRLMKQRRMTGAELARRLGGRNPSVVTRWRNGEDRPRPQTVAQIAAILDVDTMVLMRAAGYLVTDGDGEPLDTNASIESSDPRFEAIRSVWDRLDDSRKQIIHEIALAGALVVGLAERKYGFAN
jgi:transcriptional regulator with XRE-family HTH domain